MSIEEKRRDVLGADSLSLKEVIGVHGLRLIEQILRMSVHRPLFALFTCAGQGWKKRCGGQAVKYCRGIKKLD